MLTSLRRLLELWGLQAQVLARHTTRRHLVRRSALVAVVEAAGFWLVAAVVPGISLETVGTILLAVLAVGLLNAIVRPVLLALMFPLTVLAFALLTLLVNAVIIVAAAWLVPGFEVVGLGSALVAVVALAAVNTAMARLFNLDDEESFYRRVMAVAARRRAPTDEGDGDGDGLVVVQLDGVSREVLQTALEQGLAPNMGRWIEDGSHQLTEWEASLPSQSSTNQVGLLYGRIDDVPGFRWYDKRSGRMAVTSRPRDAREMARRHSGEGLLSHSGSSISNVVDGDAAHSILTFSTLVERHRHTSDFFFYFLNPYSFTRTLVLMALDVLRAAWRHVAARLAGEPRGRGWSHVLLRPVSTVLINELTLSLVIEQMHRGRRAIFCNFLAYDEVAHDVGPGHPEALRELCLLDERLAAIERAAGQTQRRYHVVVLADHGQTASLPLHRLQNETLVDVLRSALPAGYRVRMSAGADEAWGTVNAILNELFGTPYDLLLRGLSRIRRRDAPLAPIEVGPEVRPVEPPPAELLVLPSGSLANAYVTGEAGRTSLESIEQRMPGLIPALVEQEGIGFVVARSEEEGEVAIGSGGWRWLQSGWVDGDDPLASYGDGAVEHLRRLCGDPGSGDLVIHGRYDPGRDVAVTFEAMLGSHGGLGGGQMRPMLLHPSGWPGAEQRLVGAPAVHRLLRRWLDECLSASAASEQPERVIE